MFNKTENKSKMTQAISDWKISGMKQKTFCRQRGIKHSSFYYWLSKSKKEDSPFLPLGNFPSYDKTSESTPIIEVIATNGNIIRFYQTVPMEALCKLVNL